MEHLRKLSNNHIDKLLLALLVMICLIVQYSLLWISVEVPDNQWLRAIVGRVVDTVNNSIVTLIGAIIAVITGTKMGQRAADKVELPPNGGTK